MKTRKMLAAVMAVLCMTGAMPAMTSSASYDPRDVNHDGAVNIQDVIAINHHLAGTKYYLEYNQLDANQSHTVDYADTRCVMNATISSSYSACYIRKTTSGTMQTVAMPSVSSTITLDDSVNQTTGRTYKRYSCTENRYLADYTLTPTNESLNTASAQSRGLVNNNDNRVPASGEDCTGIVYLACQSFGDGTGFIVGDHVIATAAENVCDAIGILEPGIYPCRTDGTLTGISVHATEIHVPAEYVDDANALYNYALIVVEEDLSGYTHFDIGNLYNATQSEIGTIPIHVTGSPDKTGNDLDVDNQVNRLYTHNGNIYGNANTSYLRHTVDTSDGQGGSPIYTITREYYENAYHYTYTALGIANTLDAGYVSNSGVLMNKHHLMFYGNNPYISYE